MEVGYKVILLPTYQCIPPTVTTQKLGKYVPMAKNTYASIEEMLDNPFFMQSVFYQRKEGCRNLPQCKTDNLHSVAKAGNTYTPHCAAGLSVHQHKRYPASACD
jgi:hypothetical protein